VFTIGKHLGLNNGDNAVSLADGGIPGKYIGILKDGLETNLNPSIIILGIIFGFQKFLQYDFLCRLIVNNAFHVDFYSWK
jgi:hypothetical protein